jgi:ABC-type Mn2+/Zn2+ transport system permease subunit
MRGLSGSKTGGVMSDFLALLSFSVLPLVLITAFSFLTPAMGAVLAIRNEMMLALALPSVANAGMALGLFCGIDPEHVLSLYGFATFATLLSIVGASRVRNSVSNREIYLAALFVGGHILSSTFSALSPVAHSHVSHLLDGEILAIGSTETGLLATICAVFMVLAILNRHGILAWCADSEFFRVGAPRYHLFLFAIYAILATAITLGVATTGSLLVTALLVLPALFGNVGKGGIHKYLVLATGIGVTGSIAGFLVALAIDFPPAISAAVGIGAVGIGLRVLYMKR